MDSEGYPEESELQKIRTWDVKDFPALMAFVTDRWMYDDYIKQELVEDALGDTVMEWTLCTAGWSGNESLVDALLENQMFKMLWYYSWQRGGKFVFKINAKNVL